MAPLPVWVEVGRPRLVPPAPSANAARTNMATASPNPNLCLCDIQTSWICPGMDGQPEAQGACWLSLL